MTDRSFAFGRFELFPNRRLLLRAGQELRVGARAFAILVALVKRAGEVVSRDELTEAVWPDTVMEETNLRVHIAALRKALGDNVTVPQFIVTVPGRGYCFVAPLTAGSAPSTTTHKTPLLVATRFLPRQTGRVIGRSLTTEDIASNVDGRRLVTITGPGGIGKTTVALEVAASLAERFEDQVVFVDLTSVNEGWGVPGALAAALGQPVNSDDPTAELMALLQNAKLLVVLDSCEHVIGAVATLAEALVKAPGVHVLATSREILRAADEWVHRLVPLELPPVTEVPITAAGALLFSAVELFVEQASSRLGGYVLTDKDAPDVAEICRRTDGIALAIEFAVGRMDTMGLRVLADSLVDCLRVLTQGRRTALPRHQTLRATLDWSYGLLPDSERVALRRLSVFAGTFTLEAAAAVMVGDAISSAQAVDDIANLVAKSLVTADTHGPVARYRLLDTTRAYTNEKLNRSREASSCARRHAKYYCDFLESAEDQSTAGFTTLDFVTRALDIGNIRAALQWAYSSEGDAAIAFALTAAASTVFLEMSMLTEISTWAEKANALPVSAARSLRQEMLLQTSLGISILNTIGNTIDAHGALTRALEIAETLDNHEDYQLRILEALNMFHQRIPDMRAVLALAVRGETLIKVLTDRTGEPHTNWMMTSAQSFAGNHVSARAYSELAIYNAPIGRRVRRFGMDRRSNAMITLARAQWMLGFPEQAMVTANDVINEAYDLNHSVSFCIALHSMVSVALWTGDLEWAAELVARLLERSERSFLNPFRGLALGWNGALALRRGDADHAIQLLQSSLTTLDATRHRLMKTAFLYELAAALAAIGRRDESLAVIDDAIERIDQTGEFVYMPEVLRIKGDILAAGTEDDRSLADAHLLGSLACAQKQNALSWELRSATSLAKLRRLQRRHSEASTVLASVYDRFTEGLETTDLKQAKYLLNELSDAEPPRTADKRLLAGKF